jgi:hypothetical protein
MRVYMQSNAKQQIDRQKVKWKEGVCGWNMSSRGKIRDSDQRR